MIAPIFGQKHPQDNCVRATGDVLRAVQSRIQASEAVVVAAVLGSRTVEMRATRSSIIPGSRAVESAKAL